MAWNFFRRGTRQALPLRLEMVDDADNFSLTLDKLNDRTQAIARTEAALQIFDAIEHPAAKLQAVDNLRRWAQMIFSFSVSA